METLDLSSSATSPALGVGGTNPFDVDVDSDTPAMCPPPPQKGASAGAALLDLDGIGPEKPVPGAFNNGHANGGTSLYSFLEQSNGKMAADEDSESEQMEEDDEVRKATSNPFAADNNPFGAAAADDDLDHGAFQPTAGNRQETPTPPADEVPGVTGLVSDNVADSGEESEDEWNYYKAEQTGNFTQPAVETPKQADKSVCPEKTEAEEENMESQLNPNAAEFIPSPTHAQPPLEEYLTMQAKKDVSMDDIVVPSRSEFEQEVTSRPSNVGFDDSFLQGNTPTNIPDLLNGQDDFNKSSSPVGYENDPEKFTEQCVVDGASLVNLQESLNKSTSILDESEGFSTKADYGDDSTTSFMTTGSDFQKAMGLSGNTIMETSLTEQDLLPSEADAQSDTDLCKKEEPFEKDLERSQEFLSHEIQKEPLHISFELQKEIAPQMEAQPERVKVDSDEPSPVLASEPVLEIPEVSGEISDASSPALSPTPKIHYTPLPSEQEAILEQDDFLLQNNAINAEHLPSKPTEIDLPFEGSQLIEKDFLIEDPSTSPMAVEQIEYGQGDVDQSNISFKDSHIEPTMFPTTHTNVFNQEIGSLNLDFKQIPEEMKTPEYEKLEKEIEALDALNGIEGLAANDSTVLAQFEKDFDKESEEAKEIPMMEEQVNKNVLDTLGMMETETKDEQILSDTHTPPPTPQIDDLLTSDEKPQSLTQAVEKLAEVVSVPSHESTEQISVTPDQQNEEIFPTSPTESNVDPIVETSELVKQVDESEIQSIEKEITRVSPLPEDMPVSIQQEIAPVQMDEPPAEVEVTESAETSVPAVEVPQKVQTDLLPTTEEAPAMQETSESGGAQCTVNEPVTSPLEQPENVSTTADDVAATTNVSEATKSSTETVVAAVAGTAALAAVASTVTSISPEKKPIKKDTPSKDTPPKKQALTKDKKPQVERRKNASTKPVPAQSRTATTKLKSPTSPLKSAPLVPKPPITKRTVVSSTTATTTSTASRSLPKATGTVSSSLSSKLTTSTKLSPLKPASVRQPTSAADKKPLTNGDIGKTTISKQTETTKRLSRPASAPVSKPTTKTFSAVSSTIPKSKPTSLSTKPATSAVAHAKSSIKATNEKEIKDTANKQISSTRSVSNTLRSTTTATATRTTISSRKIESKTVTNGRANAMKTTTTLKPTSSNSKAPIKKPATCNSKPGRIAEKSETVQNTVITTKEIKSEALLASPPTTA